MIRWICIFAGAFFIGWTHDHTDEIPVVLGFALIVSAVLGAVFPAKPWLTGLLVGLPVFITETLVHYSVISGPYPPGSGIPWVALVALVPSMGGAFFGAAMRKLK